MKDESWTCEKTFNSTILSGLQKNVPKRNKWMSSSTELPFYDSFKVFKWNRHSFLEHFSQYSCHSCTRCLSILIRATNSLTEHGIKTSSCHPQQQFPYINYFAFNKLYTINLRNVQNNIPIQLTNHGNITGNSEQRNVKNINFRRELIIKTWYELSHNMDYN